MRFLAAMKALLLSPLSLKAKFLLYTTYIRPMMTYASPARAFIPKSCLQRLEFVQNRALRLTGGYVGIRKSIKFIQPLKFRTLRALSNIWL